MGNGEKRDIIEALLGEKVDCRHGKLEIKDISPVSDTVYLMDNKNCIYPVLLSNIEIDESLLKKYSQKTKELESMSGVA